MNNSKTLPLECSARQSGEVSRSRQQQMGYCHAGCCESSEAIENKMVLENI
jgi:hypothetical protein